MCGLHAKSVITSRLVSVLIITLHYIILDFLMNMIKLLPFTCRKVFSFWQIPLGFARKCCF